jgi:uncharacterized membrane protein
MKKHGMKENGRLERLLAGLLSYGSWLASVIIALGLVLALIDTSASAAKTILSGTNIMAIGIGLFIVLPVLRVIVMLIAFLHERDYRLSAISMLVLAIIFAGIVLGTRSTG